MNFSIYKVKNIIIKLCQIFLFFCVRSPACIKIYAAGGVDDDSGGDGDRHKVRKTEKIKPSVRNNERGFGSAG